MKPSDAAKNAKKAADIVKTFNPVDEFHKNLDFVKEHGSLDEGTIPVYDMKAYDVMKLGEQRRGISPAEVSFDEAGKATGLNQDTSIAAVNPDIHYANRYWDETEEAKDEKSKAKTTRFMVMDYTVIEQINTATTQAAQIRVFAFDLSDKKDPRFVQVVNKPSNVVLEKATDVLDSTSAKTYYDQVKENTNVVFS